MWLTEDQLLALQRSDLDNWDLGEVTFILLIENTMKLLEYAILPLLRLEQKIQMAISREPRYHRSADV